MEPIFESLKKIKDLANDIEENTNERLKEYSEELTVPANSLQSSSTKNKEKTLKKQTSATSSTTSVASAKSGSNISVTGGGSSLGSSLLLLEHPTIPEVDHDLEEEDTNAMFINDKFHIRNQSLFAENAAASKELIGLLSALSNEEIQPLLDDIVTTTFEMDEQRQESLYEENYDFFLTLIEKMKDSSTQRIQQLSHSLQLLLNRQKEIFDITIEKYKQDYGFYRMKNRNIELTNQIQKYTLKLQEIRYELSMRQEEFLSSAEDLRSRYEQELETLIRTLLQSIEDKKAENERLSNKHQSIQQDIQRICNDLSVVLHELEREEKAKAYQAIYGANKKFIDHRPQPNPLPALTTEKLEEAFNQARIDQHSVTTAKTSPKALQTTSGRNKAGSKSGRAKGSDKSPSSPTRSSLSSELNESSQRDALYSNSRPTDSSSFPEDDFDANHIFQVYPFLATSHEITDDMVRESLRISDALWLEVEGKRKELEQQEEKVNEEKQKIQTLLKSEENKALERLKMMVGNLENKIDSDGKRTELLQSLVQNLTAETKGDRQGAVRRSSRSDRKARVGSPGPVSQASGPSSPPEEVAEKTSQEGKREERREEEQINYEHLSEVEINVLKYQQLYEQSQKVLQTEREKILSRGKTPPPSSSSASQRYNSSRPLSSTLSTLRPFSSQTSSHRAEEASGDSLRDKKRGSRKQSESSSSNIKRIVTSQQVGKIHKVMEMFDYYSHLSELSEADKVQNTLIPYTHLPLRRSLESKDNGIALGQTGKPSGSSPPKSRPLTQKSVSFPGATDEEEDPTGLLEIERLGRAFSRQLSSQGSSGGRRSAILTSPNRSSFARSRSPGGVTAVDPDNTAARPAVSRASTKGTSASVASGAEEEEKESSDQKTKKNPASRGYQFFLEARDKEQQSFFAQNHGYKTALEQISAIYNLLLRWNQPSSSPPNKAIILQTDREENELQMIEVLKSQIQTLLLKCKTLYRQNTYFNSIIKDLSKELVRDLKKNAQYQQDLIQEISNLRWSATTLPGKYQLEINAMKERLLELKKESKIWEKKVAKKRVTNIRLSQLLSENSKNTRKSLPPVKESQQMVQAILQEENTFPSVEENQLPRSIPTFYSSSLAHGPNHTSQLPAFLNSSGNKGGDTGDVGISDLDGLTSISIQAKERQQQNQ